MKSLVALAFLFSFFSVSTLPGQDESSSDDAYQAAAKTVSSDLRSALDELAKLRTAIGNEKPAIAREANQIAADLREARRKADIAKTRSDAVAEEFAKTEKELKTWRDEKLYLESLLLDFRKTYEASSSIAQIESDRDILNATDLEARLALLEKSLTTLESSGRISSIAGEAVGSDGVMLQGTFLKAGPVQWFLSEDKKNAGIVTSSDNLRPKLIPDTASPGDLSSFLNGNAATPSFDPTLGTAVALTETKQSLLSHIRKGGFWIYPILFLALIALIAAVAKWFQLLKIRSLDPSRLQEIVKLVSQDRQGEALNETATIAHPAARVLAKGIKISGDSSTKDANRDDLEEAMFEQFLAEQPRLQRGLPLIAIASATAPLLGLLGTVTGMIETFRLINIFGTGDAKSLASGISEALVTTEFGLIVAIPALILHALLSRKVQGIKATMEMASLAFLNGLTSPNSTDPLRPVA